MLPPHHHYQQVCQQCGCLPAYPTAVCPLCQAPLALPVQNQRIGPFFIIAHVPCTPVPQPNYTPFVVELILNVLGIYGVGWFLLGKRPAGFILLIGSLVIWPLVATLAILTMGLGLLVVGPLAIAGILFNLLLLWQATTSQAYETALKDRV